MVGSGGEIHLRVNLAVTVRANLNDVPHHVPLFGHETVDVTGDAAVSADSTGHRLEDLPKLLPNVAGRTNLLLHRVGSGGIISHPLPFNDDTVFLPYLVEAGPAFS